jgi:hypothetical protein
MTGPPSTYIPHLPRSAPSADRTAVRRVGRVAAWVLVAGCGLCAVLRASGVDLPWPLSAMLAFTPWVILPSVLAVLAGTRGAAVPRAVDTLVPAAVAVPRAGGSANSRAGTPLRVMTANLRVGGADPPRSSTWSGTSTWNCGAAGVHVRRESQPEPRRPGCPAAVPPGRCRTAWDRLRALLPGTLTDADFPVAPGGFVVATATLHVSGAARPLAVRSVYSCAPFTTEHQRCWRTGLGGEPRADPNGVPRLLLGNFTATLDHPALRRLIRCAATRSAPVGARPGRPTWYRW